MLLSEEHMIKNRITYGVMTAGGVMGLVASFLQMLEKIQLLKNADKALACDLSSVFSCSNVLNAWQSSVFGFPNSMMCMIFFTTFAIIGLVGLTGGVLPRALRLSIHGLALFVLAFALWFLGQSIYVIGSLCILCIFCFAGLLLVNWAWLRLNADIVPIGPRGRKILARWLQSGADIFIWIVLAAVVAFAMVLRFY